jgi:beta-lactamase regulating signal transducer with metallopeptidase domain
MSPFIIEIAVKSSAILALAAATAASMWRRGSAASRHLVWTLAVLGLLALPTASAVVPAWTIPVRLVTPRAPVTTAAEGVKLSTSSMPAIDMNRRRPVPVFVMPSWSSLLFIVYVAGVLLLLSRLAFEQIRMRRVLSRTTPVSDAEWTSLLQQCSKRLQVGRAVRLLRSREATMPMTSGIRHPTVVIPSIADVWDDERRRAVLLHELAHIARKDCLTQTFAAVAGALYWPHPGVWLAARRLREERELACDDCVLASGTDARSYASHLLEIAHSLSRDQAPAIAVSMAGPPQLEQRMTAMLDATRNRATPGAGRQALALATAIILVTLLAAATMVAVPVDPGGSTESSPSASAARGLAAALAQVPTSASLSAGTCQIRLTADGHRAHLTIRIDERSSYGITIALDRAEGLEAILKGSGGPAHYTLKREAGQFDFEGVVRSGAGRGTLSFTPNSGFADELARRGFGKPTLLELGTLAWSDIGFAFIDELSAMKYERPTLLQLVNSAQHGVTRSYFREMSDLGYRVGTIDALVKLRDHGVDAAFVRDSQAEGFKGLRVDDLVRMRDRGVDPPYIRDMRALGYAGNVDQLVDARSHGIDRSYVREMQVAGFAKLSYVELVSARNHGIDGAFVRDLRQLGYQLTLDELVDARRHGVDPQFINEMTSVGYPRLSLADLVKLRSHGVDAKMVQQLKDRGRGVDSPSIDQLIEWHDRGARTPDPTSGLRLRASRKPLASVHDALRDVEAALQRWANRWLS